MPGWHGLASLTGHYFCQALERGYRDPDHGLLINRVGAFEANTEFNHQHVLQPEDIPSFEHFHVVADSKLETKNVLCEHPRTRRERNAKLGTQTREALGVRTDDHLVLCWIGAPLSLQIVEDVLRTFGLASQDSSKRSAFRCGSRSKNSICLLAASISIVVLVPRTACICLRLFPSR